MHVRVAVIGGGIGGLTTALSLHAAGIPVEVHEAVRQPRPVGVGINLLPHAVRELTELGLGDALAEIGIATEALVYANKFGQEIWRESRGLGAGYLWPQYSLHRGRLQMLLLDSAMQRIGAESIHFDRRAVRFASDTESATAFFEQGSVTADVIVAADGIHSAARGQLFPNAEPPKWNHRILWRAVAEAEPYLPAGIPILAFLLARCPGNHWPSRAGVRVPHGRPRPS